MQAPGAMPNGTRVTVTGVHKDGDGHRPGDLGTIVASLGPAKRLEFDDELHFTYLIKWDDAEFSGFLADVRLREIKGRWSVANVWLLYDHPSAHPNNFVAMRFSYDEPTNEVLFFRSLQEARRHSRALDLVCIGRHPEDDPEMVEVWL